MRTLLISEIFPPRTGGSGRWFWEIYSRLPREEFVVAAGAAPNDSAFDAAHDLRLERMPLTLSEWGIRSIRGLTDYSRAVARLRRIVAAEQVAVVHAARCLPEGVMALALRMRSRTPYVCYVHGEDVNAATTSREQAWLARRVLRNARFVIANSENTANILRTEWGMQEKRVHVLHPGVDTGRFVPKGRDATMRSRLLWGGRPVVLTVGRLQKRKGHDHMILAMERVRQAVPDVLYAIVGSGEEQAYLERLVTENSLDEHVQFLGEVSDEELIACYQQCDLFALPNRQVGRDIEGFGMVLLEAQACGRPVLAGDSGGTAETMRVGETGRIVDCSDIGRLAAEVTDLLLDRGRLERMGALGREWVLATFDWAALCSEARALFSGVRTRGRIV